MQKRDGFEGRSVVSGSHQNQKLVVVVVVFLRGEEIYHSSFFRVSGEEIPLSLLYFFPRESPDDDAAQKCIRGSSLRSGLKIPLQEGGKSTAHAPDSN